MDNIPATYEEYKQTDAFQPQYGSLNLINYFLSKYLQGITKPVEVAPPKRYGPGFEALPEEISPGHHAIPWNSYFSTKDIQNLLNPKVPTNR